MNHCETDGRQDRGRRHEVRRGAAVPATPTARPRRETPPARLIRWTFDLAGQSNTFKEEQLDDRAGEFPRFDERFCMSDYRHGWIVARRHHRPEDRRAATRRPRPLRPQDRQERSVARRPGRPLRRAGVRAARRRRGRRRRLAAERALSRRGQAPQRSRGVRGDRHRPRARSRWPTCRAACRPASTATGGRVRSEYDRDDHRPPPQQLALAAHPVDARGARRCRTRSSATSATPTMQAPPALQAVHPLGKSPVITDGDKVLAESGAILEYLVDTYGNGRLAPARRHARAAALHLFPALRRRLVDAAAADEAGVQPHPRPAAVLHAPGRQGDRGRRQQDPARPADRHATSCSSKASWRSATGSPAPSSPPPTSR